MAYKGDLVTRTGERLADWAWAGRLSPRTVMLLAGLWLVAIWALCIFLIKEDKLIEPQTFLVLLMPGNLIGTAGLRHRSSEAPPDEWEQALRAKAFVWGGNVTLGVIALWMAFSMGLADNSWFWQPSTEGHWTIVFLLAVTTWMSATTIAAAWFTPPYAAEIDEYD